MKSKKINIGIVGLGHIGGRLYKEILLKKKDIAIKTNKEVNILAISAKSINKKRNCRINKKIFYKNMKSEHVISLAKEITIEFIEKNNLFSVKEWKEL